MQGARIRRGLALGLVLLAFWTVAAEAQIVRFRLDDNIHPASQAYVERCLEEAAARDAELVVMELDTPGGLVEPTRDLTSAITSSAVPVVVWVTPAGARAASAGFFLLLAADWAVMSPGTNTGAAHPVLLMFAMKEAEVSEEMKEKVVNDVTALVRSLAEPRGRNVEAAVEAVTESRSFTATEALEADLVDGLAGSFEELVASLDGTEVTRFDGSTVTLELEGLEQVEITPNSREQLHFMLGNPLIVLILMALAAIGIFTELTHPGGILPGVVGVIALLLFLYSTSVLPVNYAGIGLIVVALILFVLEVKVVSYGLLTVAGLVCFVLGSMMMFDTPVPGMRLTLPMVLPTALLVAAVVVFLVARVIKAHQRRPSTGEEGLVGETGTVLTALAPEGKVKIHGEYWDARSLAGEIEPGERVDVVAVVGRRLDVRPADQGLQP